MKTTSLRLRFWISNYRIPPLETRYFAVETRRKSGRLRRTKDEQPTLLTRKRRPRRGEEKERRSRLQRTWWPQMLEVGENRTETGPVAGSLLLPGYGASCWIRNESFWTIALNNVCIIEARVARGREIFMTAAEGEIWLARRNKERRGESRGQESCCAFCAGRNARPWTRHRRDILNPERCWHEICYRWWEDE